MPRVWIVCRRPALEYGWGTYRPSYFMGLTKDGAPRRFGRPRERAWSMEEHDAVALVLRDQGKDGYYYWVEDSRQGPRPWPRGCRGPADYLR